MSHIDAKATPPQISQFIREVRMQTGLTQEQFASRLGVVFSTLSRWEKDESPLPPWGCRKSSSTRSTLGASEEDEICSEVTKNRNSHRHKSVTLLAFPPLQKNGQTP
ncbi:MAG: helix-turn-helix domain-containing protein [Oscillatoria princeps RMCB-10]|nr:helix-turn-helix domain-containing protein [Oscillatoria princeps RMCB-10]